MRCGPGLRKTRSARRKASRAITTTTALLDDDLLEKVLREVINEKAIVVDDKIWGYQDLTATEQRELLKGVADEDDDGDFERNGPELAPSSDEEDCFVEGDYVSDDEDTGDDDDGDVGASRSRCNTTVLVAQCRRLPYG